MIKILLAFLLLFTFSSGAMAQGTLVIEEAPQGVPQEDKNSSDYSVDDLIFDCKKCVEDVKSPECIYCDGMLTGAAQVLGMYEYGKTFCPPAEMDTVMTRNFFRKWALYEGRRDPAAMQLHAVEGVVKAMQATFPCKPSEQQLK